MNLFFKGALFAYATTAVLMWWVFGYTNLVGAKVERATATSTLNGAVFSKDFDKRWADLGGDPVSCSSTGADHIAALRKQVAELQKEVDQGRQAAKQKASVVDHIVGKAIEKVEGKDENH